MKLYRIVAQDCVYPNRSFTTAYIAAQFIANHLLEKYGELGKWQRGDECEWYTWRNNHREILLSVEREIE